MKITDKQHKLLSKLKCVRLSAQDFHRDIIKDFSNSRNPGLVSHINRIGWDEDVDGSTAYYIVTNEDNEVFLFFSLKCGALFQHFNEDQLREQKKLLELAKHLISSPKDQEEKEIGALILDKFRSSGAISDDDLKALKQIKLKTAKLEDLLDVYNSDIEIEKNENIVRVDSTHSGIELVHFCANDNAKGIWKSYGLQHPLGKVIFWKFIIPIVKHVKDLVGCKYLFLFAADSTVDYSLVNYYKVELHFERPDNIGTNKPRYDFNCIFMCQEVDHLIDERKRFFENFNIDHTDELI